MTVGNYYIYALYDKVLWYGVAWKEGIIVFLQKGCLLERMSKKLLFALRSWGELFSDPGVREYYLEGADIQHLVDLIKSEIWFFGRGLALCYSYVPTILNSNKKKE